MHFVLLLHSGPLLITALLFYKFYDQPLQVIMCSSAGVTRPSWPEDKKTRYPGAADIPIVRLNPFNILNIKKDGKKTESFKL